MAFRLAPARRRGVEILDDPATPADVRDRAMADVVRSNTLFGGRRAARRALRFVLSHVPRERLVLLDVGTGLADVPARLRRDAAAAGHSLDLIGLDVSHMLLPRTRGVLDGAVCGDARRLPLRDASVDVVTCSQLLHHFEEPDARVVLAELHRVARQWVVVSDLRRSWLAAGGYWAAATLLRFHRVTRHDGVVSVLRGFTPGELGRLVREATGRTPIVRRSLFWRVTATWTKQAGGTAA